MQKSKLNHLLFAFALLGGAAGIAQAADAAAPVAATAQADETIQMSAKAAIGADAQSATLPVSVSVRKGVVILSGEVPSAEAGDRVVQIVASVSGVREVKNELRVKSAG